MPAPRLRLSPEWQCWPLWDVERGHNIDPADLDLPEALRLRLLVWDDVFQGLYETDDFTSVAFESREAEAAWRAEGRQIAKELERALDCGTIVHKV